MGDVKGENDYWLKPGSKHLPSRRLRGLLGNKVDLVLGWSELGENDLASTSYDAWLELIA
jgi:hypothetical protein